MIVERIQVEEGFLDGLDLSFSSGLNVLIGPRGCGKTSIIELIRFCLGAEALTDRMAQTSREHALSILGSGRVTVTVSVGENQHLVSRSAESWSKPTGVNLAPLILSQNEIESVGLHSMGRLRLIDSLCPSCSFIGSPNDEAEVLAHIKSQSLERQSVSKQLNEVRASIRNLTQALSIGEDVKKQHSEALQNLEKARAETTLLEKLGKQLAEKSVRSSILERNQKSVREWREKLLVLRPESLMLESLFSDEETEPILHVKQLLMDSQDKVASAIEDATKALELLQHLQQINSEKILGEEDQARGIRRKLESLQEGAGEMAKKLAKLQEKEGQLEALRNLEKQNLTRLERIQVIRNAYLDKLEEIRNGRFEERENLVFYLNSELGPRIRIQIERAGQTSEYSSAIIAALRGSGLRFNDVAPLISEQMSPREFVEAIEFEDTQLLSSATGLTPGRAAKIIERINEEGVEDILTANIEDGVVFSLLDGKEFKNSENISTGQRCTVVLPILLHQNAVPLIVDQPEDHLDNAFVVETVIKAIRNSALNNQLIFSTHNANIPVLGAANRVVFMGSDGSRGFVKFVGNLDDPKSVTAITNVMEGGLEAFDLRSKFYHESSDHES